MGMQFEASSPRNVYRDPKYVGRRGLLFYAYLIVGGIFGVWALWYTFTVVEPLPLYGTLIIIALWALGGGFLLRFVITRRREQCLVTTPEGIEYAGRGFRIFTPW